LQTIIAYNENEVKEHKEFSNIEPKDKAWIDLIDPTAMDFSIVILFIKFDTIVKL